jgi:hypothetical protein
MLESKAGLWSLYSVRTVHVYVMLDSSSLTSGAGLWSTVDVPVVLDWVHLPASLDFGPRGLYVLYYGPPTCGAGL